MSKEEMLMPQLGESVTEGTINQWLVSVGDRVAKYDPIAEVTTDKVNAEVPSSFDGTIIALLAEEGETLPVGQPICAIQTNDVQPGATHSEPKNQKIVDVPEMETKQPARGRFSPSVRRLARENHIALETVQGTGRGGRITRKDIELYKTNGNKQQQHSLGNISEPASRRFSAAPIHVKPEVQTASNQAAGDDHLVPLTGVRRAIAANMVRSVHEIPHAWTMIEVDVTNLVAYRNQVKGAFQKKEGQKLTYLPFFIKAIVAALKEFPRMNSTWAGDKIIEKKAINLSLAVAAEDALYVPVIRHADEKSIMGLATAVNQLAAKVRDNQLSPDDMQEGTFTVNNTGSFGSIQSQPIINYPQAAILSIESIVKRPVVINNMIAIRDMVNLCISIDHRVLDGLITGKFLARIKTLLESVSAENTPLY
ncbi:MAG: dihydrolipoamide acetyltransferase family protein [Sporolactobacillus sp.]